MKATIKDVRLLINQSRFTTTFNVTKYNDDASKTVTPETFQGSLIFRTLLYKFGSWKWISYGDNLTECALDLIEAWEDYISINKYNLERQLSALKTEFNPAWNYDKHSTINTKYGEMVTENDIGQRVDKTPKMVTTNLESPEDSQNFYGTNKTEVEAYNLISEQAHDESKVNEHRDEVTQRDYGNIGVMTSTQAINEVLETYQKAFLTLLIEGFTNEYLYL